MRFEHWAVGFRKNGWEMKLLPSIQNRPINVFRLPSFFLAVISAVRTID